MVATVLSLKISPQTIGSGYLKVVLSVLHLTQKTQRTMTQNLKNSKATET